MNFFILLSLWALQSSYNCVNAKFEDTALVTNYTRDLVKVKHVVLCGCHLVDVINITKALHQEYQFVRVINLNGNYSLKTILTARVHAKTAIVVDTNCTDSRVLVREASEAGYLNKTYQWLLWDSANLGINYLIPSDLPYLGPNAQVTYINRSNELYQLWDVHSKGWHLGAKLEISLLGEKNASSGGSLVIHDDIINLQGIHRRKNFHGLTLRAASVIDQENITTNEQVERILSRTTKDSGVSAFSKYHYEIMKITSECFNFTVGFRNARGWAGHLGNTTFRLGYLGIMKRNEADIGASAIFGRINRLAEFDIIHQSWKFETAFLYRFTPDLETHGKSGNFLAPFEYKVWLTALATLLMVNAVWRLVEYIKYINKISMEHKNAKNKCLSGITLKTFAAICQQGLDPIPKGLATRVIILTTFLFSLVMYNYYTSSVVGGLLSSSARGPSTVDQIISSPLKLSFEDIGYYKVIFRERKSPRVVRLLKTKVLPPRLNHDLPVYTHINEAMPYLKNGSFAFHCEVVDAYPEIAKHFDVNEICELRVVSGLLETKVINWVLTKNSIYTELFRILAHRAREGGLIERLLHQRQPKKPKCQATYTFYPVSLPGVFSAFYILCGAVILSLLVLCIEKLFKKYEEYICKKFKNTYPHISTQCLDG